MSAPRQSDSRRMSAAFGGPMVMTVTVPPWRSLIWTAISSAFRSSGLKMADSAARFIVPSLVITSPVMLWVSGTCFARTTMSIGLESVIQVSGERRPAPAIGGRRARAADASRVGERLRTSAALR